MARMALDPTRLFRNRVDPAALRRAYAAAEDNAMAKARRRDLLDRLASRRRTIIGKTKDVDEKEGIVVGMVSTGELDRDSEVVVPGAFSKSLPGFMENPVVLWAHQHSEPPVGTALEMEDLEEGLRGTTKFARKESEFAELIFRLYASDPPVLRAWSAGFIPKAWDDKPVTQGQKGLTITEAELFEYSAVPVPSNRGALTETIKAAIFGAERDFHRLTKPDLDREPPEGEGMKIQSVLIPTETFSLEEAKTWIEENDFFAGGLESEEPEGEYFRFRQFDPEYCETTPRTIDLDEEKGIKGVGCNTEKEEEDGKIVRPIILSAFGRQVRTVREWRLLQEAKVGRVLSAKNREAVLAAIDTVGAAVKALKDVIARDDSSREPKKSTPFGVITREERDRRQIRRLLLTATAAAGRMIIEKRKNDIRPD